MSKKNPSPTVKKNPALKSDLYESGGCNKYVINFLQILLKICDFSPYYKLISATTLNFPGDLISTWSSKAISVIILGISYYFYVYIIQLQNYSYYFPM